MDAPTDFETFPHLERLLAEFASSTVEARSLASRSAAEDEFIACGMVGFSRHVQLDHWEKGHLKYLRQIRDEVANGEFSDDWIRFTCLAGGYFLGMATAGLVTEPQLRLAEAHTPGFMWLRAEAFGSLPENGVDS